MSLKNELYENNKLMEIKRILNENTILSPDRMKRLTREGNIDRILELFERFYLSEIDYSDVKLATIGALCLSFIYKDIKVCFEIPIIIGRGFSNLYMLSLGKKDSCSRLVVSTSYIVEEIWDNLDKYVEDWINKEAT